MKAFLLSPTNGKHTKDNSMSSNNMMRPYSDVAAELSQRQPNNYMPPSIPSVKQTPVEIPGVMYQARELFQPIVSNPQGDK
jgi:hypothetical protein